MNSFSEIKKIYYENLKSNKSYLEESQWQNLAFSLRLSKKEFLFYSLNFIKEFSQSPISNFKVGAVGLGISNRLYFGTNIEFLGFPLNQSIHAEQCLISLAYAQQEKSIKEIYLTAFPCGHCRQFLREMVNFKEVEIIISSDKDKKFLLKELLPHSFGPQDLQVTQTLFSDNSSSLVNKILNKPKKMSAELEEKILSSLRQSFAPYSQNPAGVVIVFENENTIQGSSIESCAFNPSLSAFHMAYANLIVRKLDPTKIQEVYLVEMEKSHSRQFAITQMLLKSIAPQAKLFELCAISSK